MVKNHAYSQKFFDLKTRFAEIKIFYAALVAGIRMMVEEIMGRKRMVGKVDKLGEVVYASLKPVKQELGGIHRSESQARGG